MDIRSWLKGSSVGDKNAGEVRRICSSLGIAKECRSKAMASCECWSQRHSPINFSWFVLASRVSLIEAMSPREEPRRVAPLALTNCRPGNEDRSTSTDDRSWLMSSDFSTLRCRPSSLPFSSIDLRSSKMSSRLPPIVPSSR